MVRRPFVLSAVLAGLSFALTGCDEKTLHDPRTEPLLVRDVVIEGAGSASRQFTGTVAARVQSDLGFRVSGKVLERLVDVGQSVRRGQVLMRMDATDLKLAFQAQQEAVVAARARATQTADEEARYRDLRGTGAISASAYDQVKAAADAAKAQLASAVAQAEIAHNASRYAELAADADGVVTQTLAEPGQVVSPGQTVVRVAHAGRREAVVQLPETVRPALGTVGQATLYGKEGMTVPARLRVLSDAADPLTRTFDARYVLEGELANAPLGTTVTVRIPDDRSVQGALVVPIGALFDAGKGPGVWVISSDTSEVSWRPVEVRQLDDEGARIAGRIQPGDRVVALGAHLLREGQRVRMAGKVASVAEKP